MRKERFESLMHPREKYENLNIKQKQNKGILTVRLPVFCLLQRAAQRLLLVSQVTPVLLTVLTVLPFLPFLQSGLWEGKGGYTIWCDTFKNMSVNNAWQKSVRKVKHCGKINKSTIFNVSFWRYFEALQSMTTQTKST